MLHKIKSVCWKLALLTQIKYHRCSQFLQESIENQTRSSIYTELQVLFQVWEWENYKQSREVNLSSFPCAIEISYFGLPEEKI